MGTEERRKEEKRIRGERTIFLSFSLFLLLVRPAVVPTVLAAAGAGGEWHPDRFDHCDNVDCSIRSSLTQILDDDGPSW